MSEEVKGNEQQGPDSARYREALLVSMSAVEELFNEPLGTVTITIYPEDAEGNELEPVEKEVQFRPCKTKHLNTLTTLIYSLTAGFSDGELAKVLTFVTDEQKKLLDSGVNPYMLNTETLVQKAQVSGGTMLALFQGALSILPPFVSKFTNLTAEEFNNADALQGALVAYGIFARNYHFFIQNGPLLGRAFMASLASRAVKNENKAKP